MSKRDVIRVVRVICRLRGTCEPWLAEASDGSLYVIKPGDCACRPNLLFNEAAGYELYKACGLPTPEWKAVVVNRSCFAGCDPRSTTSDGIASGENELWFGSQYLTDGYGGVLETLRPECFTRVQNRTAFWLAWLLDICACHTDHRQAVFTKLSCRDLQAVFIDHGHLFGGPDGDLYPAPAASQYLDKRIYGRLDPATASSLQNWIRSIDIDALWRRINLLPEEWKSSRAISRFSDCLNRIVFASYSPEMLVHEAHARSSAPSLTGELNAPRTQNSMPYWG